jgi:hypothetical protein
MASRPDSRRESKLSMSQAGDTEEMEIPDIEDGESLLRALRGSRIDREKIEAVENYLQHTKDSLIGFPQEMHEIMSLFVFQASRRVLLTRLTEVSDEIQKKLQTQESDELKRRAENLSAAVKHADEEVRRLEYWSDVKQVVEGGESKGAVEQNKGWDDSWRGLDASGPAPPQPNK